jgi:hypothetical protein
MGLESVDLEIAGCAAGLFGGLVFLRAQSCDLNQLSGLHPKFPSYRLHRFGFREESLWQIMFRR